MKSLNCPSCGAPIEIDEESVVQVCSHCGSNLAPTRHLWRGRAPTDAGARVEVHRIDLSGLRRPVAKSFGCLLLVLVLVLGIGGFVAWRAFTMQSSIRSSIESVTRGLSESPTAVKKGPLPVSALAEPSFRGRHEISAAPPPSPLSAYDPVAGLPWALALAQVWSDDVKLERIDVDRLRPDGTINVQDDPEAEVTYRFVSPRRFQALRERANLESRPKGDQEFWIVIENGKLFAYELETHAAFASDREAAEIDGLTWPKSLSMPEILRGAARRREFPDVPFYKGYLIRLEDEGWCWYLSTLSGSPSIPRVRARDGKSWPY